MLQAMHWREMSEAHERPRYAVLGEDPDAELTTLAMSAEVRALGRDVEIVRLQCGAGEFKTCIAHLTSSGFRGAAICNPFKSEAAGLAKQFFIVRHALGVAN